MSDLSNKQKGELRNKISKAINSVEDIEKLMNDLSLGYEDKEYLKEILDALINLKVKYYDSIEF